MMSFIASFQDSSLLPFLFDVALKSLLILIFAKGLLLLTRRASAATRHLILSGAICGLLALPVLTFTLPAWQLPILPALLSTTSAAAAPETIAADTPLQEQHLERETYSEHLFYSTHTPSPVTPREQPSSSSDIDFTLSGAPTPEPVLTAALEKRFSWLSVLLGIWIAGAIVVLLKIVFGTMKVWWVARQAEPITDVCWQMMTTNLATKLRLRLPVRLQRSQRVAVPMTWGTMRPVVLLPRESEAWSLQCRSIVLLHELAHVKRLDCLTQMLAQLACAIYWFNPLVWFAARQLRVEREFACDDQVLEAGTRATDYASHLVEIASAFRLEAEMSSMAVGMACSELESRVRAILNANLSRKTFNLSQMILAIAGVVLLVLPLAVVQPWAKAATRTDNHQSLTASVDEKNEINLLEKVAALPSAPAQAATTDEPRQPSALTHEHKEPHQIAESSAPQSEAAQDPVIQEAVKEAEEEQSDDKSAAKDEKPSAKPSVDGAIKMKMFNITPEFIEAMRKAGFENLTINQLAQLRTHNITEDYIREVRSWGYDNLSLNQIVQLRVANVTGAYLETMKRAGFTSLSVNRLASMRMQGVTPEYIEMLRRQGYDNLSPNQILSFRIQGITEEFIQSAQSWGYGKLSSNDLVQIKIFNVNPEFARQMQALGFANLTLRNLIQMRVHNLTAAYVNEMRGMGLGNLSLDELLQMKIQGITPAYIKKMRDAGFTNVTVKELIKMRIHGVDEILLKKNR